MSGILHRVCTGELTALCLHSYTNLLCDLVLTGYIHHVDFGTEELCLSIPIFTISVYIFLSEFCVFPVQKQHQTTAVFSNVKKEK